MHNKIIGASNIGAQKASVHDSKILAPNICASKTSVKHHYKIQTDQLKTDAKKDGDSIENLLIKRRLHKAKRTLEDLQKLNIKQWTSLKNSVEKETKTW